MSKEEAIQLAQAELEKFRKMEYSELVKYIGKDPITFEKRGHQNGLYQLEIMFMWDNHRRGDIRVCAAIDGEGISPYRPWCEDFIKSPDGSFVGEGDDAVQKGKPDIFKNFSIKRVLVVAAIVAVVLGGIAWQRGMFRPLVHAPANAIMVLEPYRHAGTWVFDDKDLGLRKEAFVSGIPQIIDDMVKDIPGADTGFRLTFSAMPFPGYTHKLEWRRGDHTGNWYYCKQLDMEGWLCAALFLYYKEAPKELYAKAEKK